ncbi:hypothetical protein Rhe02_77260 [Rhizocola hellebori]|uniref:Uncharacterized protein n=1 Tax=Rhizocola hellebori TaxID=1392758 RepID=A0A8J3QF01_9ACTN|nr:hypothetical protein [Rhizocola hellebori]GIH09659.1 hypothetical protein Rhe02_77260 [Rhizocola hellebori]
MTKVEALLAQIGDPEDDSTPAYDLVAELSEADQALVPELKMALWNFLKTQNFYGRDILADALAAVQGIEALPALLKVSTYDLGDDQDTLQSTIIDVMSLDTDRARVILDELDASDDAKLREVSKWAREMADSFLDNE